jgi:hypothetical protein
LIVCVDCGRDVGSDNPRKLRCAPCKRVRTRELDRALYAKQREARRAQRKRWHSTSPAGRMLSHAKARAREQGWECTITLADIQIPETCPVLAIPLVSGDKKMHGASPSLDRIDPERGYTPANVWVISNRANRIKNDSTPAELRTIADAVDREQARRRK